MKKILLLILITFLLIGCAVEEKEYTKPTADSGSPEVTETDLPAEKIPEKTTSTKTGPTFVTKDLEELTEKSNSVTSFEYSYSLFEKGTEGYYAHVFAKGNKIKQEIELGSGTYTRNTHYDVVYFDVSKGTVKAYCEAEDCDDRNALIDIASETFETETPFDVLNAIENGYKSGSAMYENRDCIIVKYESNGKTIKVWLWDYKGLPLKYEVRSGETLTKKAEFKTLVINGVKDSQLDHIEVEEI